jgi:hypothetical protein
MTATIIDSLIASGYVVSFHGEGRKRTAEAASDGKVTSVTGTSVRGAARKLAREMKGRAA